jgi:anaerobic selenocysteine-containing dehydrogenase
MSENLSRREFLKIIGLSTAVSATLTHISPLSDLVSRQLDSRIPEFFLPDPGDRFATTCGECPAGCGLVVQTEGGRVQQVAGNPNHPVNLGVICPRAHFALDGLYYPGRIKGPARQTRRGSGSFEALDWETAIGKVADALQAGGPGGIAFLMGLFPDHLFDLVKMLVNAPGEAASRMNALRYSTLGELEGRVTLMDAAQRLFGVSKIPYFDMQHAGVTFSFGANFSETWLSPVAYSRQYQLMRQGFPGQRGYLVQFEPRRSQTASLADEWIPVNPGSEMLVARALASLVAELNQVSLPQAINSAIIVDAAHASGISESELRRLARLFADAPRKLAIPGGLALGGTNGLAAAEAILALNILVNNLGQPGGLFFTPDLQVNPQLLHRPSTIAEIGALVERMKSGQIKTLFIHGANPVYDLPAKLGFARALECVPLVISFASFPDETSSQADYVLPDHTHLESWGYQKVVTGGDRMVVSGLQPVVSPLYDTRATSDVLLAAVRAVGGDLAAALPFRNELDFLQKSVAALLPQDGFHQASGLSAFWSFWQQYGGWWHEKAGLSIPQVSKAYKGPPGIELAHFSGEEQEYPYYLIIFPYIYPGESRANSQPGLQGTPDSNIPPMEKTWVEINPLTARALGVRNNEDVKVTSTAGEIEAIVYESPAIRLDVVAVSLRQERTILGGYAAGRGCNPLDLLEVSQDNSGNLAFLGTRVKITPVDLNQNVWREDRIETA